MSSREYPATPLVAVSALVHRGGRALLVRRARPPNAGRWALPGGLVELGETLEAALLREVKEEAGIGIRVERLLDAISSIEPDARGRAKYHYVLICYLARPLTGRVRLNEESSDRRWLTPSEAEQLDVTEGTARVLRLFQRRRQSHS
ncbi:MAG: NUDIX hydrolase [Nitrososphaerota archaeon]|nr:NUDIX hydrolase [Nitrososphaerota archaeon]